MTKQQQVKMVDLVDALTQSSNGLRLPKLNPISAPSSICFNLVGVDGIPYHLVTMTTYDVNGEKNYRAMPLNKFLSVVTKFEDAAFKVTYTLRQEGKEVLEFENSVMGSGNKSRLTEFAAITGVHRYAFVRDSKLGLFLRDLTSVENVETWKASGINVMVSYNKN